MDMGAVTVRSLTGLRDTGYLDAVPPAIAIDGAFSDWTAIRRPQETGTSTALGNTNVDLTAYGEVVSGQDAYLFAEVEGQMMGGTVIPFHNPVLYLPPTPTVRDADRDTVPDEVDPLPADFDNDQTPDTEEGGDVDSDDLVDFDRGGTDCWLNATIPGFFPDPFADRVVRRYICPIAKPSVRGARCPSVLPRYRRQSPHGIPVRTARSGPSS